NENAPARRALCFGDNIPRRRTVGGIHGSLLSAPSCLPPRFLVMFCPLCRASANRTRRTKGTESVANDMPNFLSGGSPNPRTQVLCDTGLVDINKPRVKVR